MTTQPLRRRLTIVQWCVFSALLGLLLPLFLLLWRDRGTLSRILNCPNVSSIQIVRTLLRKDLIEARRIARREIWRGVVPSLGWCNIKCLPMVVRLRASERIRSITANNDGTIEVLTCMKGRELFTGRSKYCPTPSYILRKQQGAWKLIAT